MRIFFSVAACACLLISSCSKKSSEVSVSGFTPLTTGTNWTYSLTQTPQMGAASTSTYKLTLTNRDTTINGNSGYKVVSNSAGPNIYLGLRNGEYYRVGLLSAIISGSFEELYLKDNITAASTWQQSTTISANGTPVALTLAYKIGEIGITKTVAGKAYNNVSEVKLDVNGNFSGFGLSIGTGSFYYAQGIGLISYDLTINTLPGLIGFTQKAEIQSYEIK